jgi:hypothetical protein
MYSDKQLGEEFGLDPPTVGKIFASMKVKRQGKEYNVGLKVKSSSRMVYNPEWVQRQGKKWYYGENARSALAEYVKLFPKIVEAIRNAKGMYFDFDDDDELKRCYEWAKAFRKRTYKRIDVRTGEDLTGVK